MTQQPSVVIGDLVATAQEVLSAALALVQEDENVRLKIVNKIRTTQNLVLEQKVALLEKNGTGDMEEVADGSGTHAEGEEEAQDPWDKEGKEG